MKYISILVLINLCLTINTFSQVQFTTHIITPGAGTTDNATYVLAFDVDGDDDMDILSASAADDKVAWYENDGSQNFSQHIITTDADGVSWIHATDMEPDGDIDVFSASLLDDKVAWYENDGNGFFTTHVIDSGPNPNGDYLRFSVYAHDIDGDDDMDVLSGGWDNPEIKWHENDGSDTTFTTHVIDTTGQQTYVIAQDLDSDDDADILATSVVFNTVTWYENDGDQNFTRHVISDSANSVRYIITKDLDKDGDVDVVAGLYDSHVEWFENDGDGNFTIHSITTSLSNSNVIYVIDLDNDGDDDILTGSGYINTIGWLENDGDENFTFHTITSNAGDWPSSVWAADVDSDGDIDALSSSLYGDEIAWYENSLITGVETDHNLIQYLRLNQNYPNPFNPMTKIEFTLLHSVFVTLKVYNILGEEVTTLVQAYKLAGQYTINFDASTLASGLYFYTLTAGEFRQTHKMVLLR